jgi:hypothetical protein
MTRGKVIAVIGEPPHEEDTTDNRTTLQWVFFHPHGVGIGNIAETGGGEAGRIIVVLEDGKVVSVRKIKK